ncbi:MuF-like minor capsid protein [Mycobacterium phage Kashi_RDG1]|nr:MuF-like minor capsid protein [Mycobacterium phage Kashi_RDG1]
MGGAVDRLLPRLGGLTRSEGLAVVSDVYPTLLDPFLSASGEMTAQWYREQTPAKLVGAQVAGTKALAPAKDFLPEPAPLPDRRQLAASGRWALLQRNPGVALRGTATRSVFDSSRRTVRDNAIREGVKWTRYASANACGFCRMLATRALTTERQGAPGLYGSKATAERNPHSFDLIRGHDHCKCLAVPVRSGGYTPPEYVHDWLADYDAVSVGPDGALRNPWEIARLMEARGDERIGKPKRKPGRPRKPAEPVEDVRSTPRETVRATQHLVDTGSERAAAYGAIAHEHVLTAQQVITRTDEVVSTAAHITQRVKLVTDVADKVLGGAVPVVRDVKRVVDAADKALGSAAQVTGGARQAADIAAQAIDSTVQVAHGAKQIADEVRGVLDEVGLVAAGLRTLFTDTRAAVHDTVRDARTVRSLSDLSEQIGAAADTARHIADDGRALVDRAKGAVDATQGIAQGVREIPDLLRQPIADAQELAQTIAGAAGDASQAVSDLQDVARAMGKLIDAVAGSAGEDVRQAARQAADDLGRIIGDLFKAPEAPRAPVSVMSERLDVPGARALGGSQPVPAIAERVGLKPLDGRPPMKALEAAPERPPVADVLDVEVVEAPAPAASKPKPTKRTLDEVEAEFQAAVEAGDDAAIDALVAEMEKLEAAEKKAAERAAAKAAAKQAETEAKTDRMLELIEQGWDPAEAESEAFGLTVEFIRRRDFMAEARAAGHEGRSFDELLGWVFEERITEAYFAAEDATRGQMLKRRYGPDGKNVDPRKLWTFNEATARKYMSDEMAEWFDQHGRITRAGLKEAILSGRGNWRSATTADFLQ